MQWVRRMLRNGIYRVTYTYEANGLVKDHALAIVRDGRIIASDRHGGVYVSGPPQASSTNSPLYTVSAMIPPYGELASGFQAGDTGTAIEIQTIIQTDGDRHRAVLTIDGVTIEAELDYLQDLQPDDQTEPPPTT